MAIPAGWYDDGSGRQRWWDGTAWTEHTVATESSTTAASGMERQRADEDSALSVATDPTFEPPYAWPAAHDTTPYPGIHGDPSPFSRTPTTAAATAVTPPYSAAQFGPSSPVPAKTTVSVLGIIGLGVAVLGVVIACIPPISVAGWVLLGIGFILSLISLFLGGAKWPGAVGMGVAALGSIIAVAVMLLSLGATGLSSIAPTPSASPGTSQNSGSDDTGASGEGSPGGEDTETVTVNELAVGHCLPLVEWEEEVYELPIVPCDQAHTDEVYFIFDAPDGEYPGDDGLQTLATDRCDAAFAEFIGVPYAESQFDNYWFVPTEASWKRLNDRAIQCIVVSYDEVTGTLEGAAR